jgi:hypothetical protein
MAFPAGSAALLEGVHPAVVMPKNIVSSSIVIRLFFSQDFNKLNIGWLKCSIKLLTGRNPSIIFPQLGVLNAEWEMREIRGIRKRLKK